MKIGKLIYHEDFGRGIIEKKSPSGSLIGVRFKKYEERVVLSSSLTLLN